MLLSDGLQEIQSNIVNEFQQEFAHIRYQGSQYLEDNRLLENPKQISDLIEADIDGLIAILSQKLKQQASDLYGRLESVTQLNFNRFEVELLE